MYIFSAKAGGSMPHHGDGFLHGGGQRHSVLPSPLLDAAFPVYTQQRYQGDLIFRDEASHLPRAE